MDQEEKRLACISINKSSERVRNADYTLEALVLPVQSFQYISTFVVWIKVQVSINYVVVNLSLSSVN